MEKTESRVISFGDVPAYRTRTTGEVLRKNVHNIAQVGKLNGLTSEILLAKCRAIFAWRLESQLRPLPPKQTARILSTWDSADTLQ